MPLYLSYNVSDRVITVSIIIIVFNKFRLYIALIFQTNIAKNYNK